ncbi:MAG: hypothetical protein ACTSQD_09085, partial [Promethearchaeota archaeon]
MEWGIINKDNYKAVNIVPLKRWDPLSTLTINTQEFGLHKKLIRYYGHYSYLSPIRAKRPRGISNLEKLLDPKTCTVDTLKHVKDIFMAVTEGKPVYDDWGKRIGDGFTIIITEDEKKRDKPFLDGPHRIERLPDSCKALTLINRFPSMARIIDSNIKSSIDKNLPIHSSLAMGINLVIERDYYDIPVSPFFNIGSKVGGSQPRIHSQVYIDLNGDGHGSRLEGYLKAFQERGDNCHLCETTHGDSSRVILKSEYWTFYVSGSPIRNYHLRFHPNEHIRRFTQLNINQLNDLADSLKVVFMALDKLSIDSNRNILFNSCPYGYDADFHLFGDIIPHEIIGGAEMADDMRVARKLPNKVAVEIR